jgi:very-short-patch-repair endonuclease
MAPALVELLMFARSLVTPAQARLLEDRARAMRWAPTRSEEWLWRRLSGSKTGVAFRRQLVIGPCIVDFACTKIRLVVEVDGGYHAQRERHDAQRDRVLTKLSWSVLRIQEERVFEDLDGVVETIIAHARTL